MINLYYSGRPAGLWLEILIIPPIQEYNTLLLNSSSCKAKNILGYMAGWLK